jgi:hypothetical protein
MSNCVGGSSGFGLPASAVAEHGVEGGDHLAHDGDEMTLGFLPAAARRLWNVLRAGLQRQALRAAM